MGKRKQVEVDDMLRQVMEHIIDMMCKARLGGKPFVLGLLTKQQHGILSTALQKNVAAFRDLGAVSFEWRDDGLRSRVEFDDDELLISIQGTGREGISASCVGVTGSPLWVRAGVIHSKVVKRLQA